VIEFTGQLTLAPIVPPDPAATAPATPTDPAAAPAPAAPLVDTPTGPAAIEDGTPSLTEDGTPAPTEGAAPAPKSAAAKSSPAKSSADPDRTPETVALRDLPHDGPAYEVDQVADHGPRAASDKAVTRIASSLANSPALKGFI
jgi:hypothetical protein